MNRIILIGNGFDLAHALKTGYKDFMDCYWKDHLKRMHGRPSFEGEFFKVTANPSIMTHEMNSYREFEEFIDNKNRGYAQKQIKLEFKNKFFGHISKMFSLRNWVDIENEYYRFMKHIHRRHYNLDIRQEQSEALKAELEKLNKDLSEVKNKLVDYLKNIQDNKITDDIVNREIQELLFEPFDPRDISNGGQRDFSEFIKSRYNAIKEGTSALMRKHYKNPHFISFSEIEDYLNQKDMNILRHESNVRSKSTVPLSFALPENTMIVNFNYTTTASYYTKGFAVKLNHIHGELDNPENPIIFGYGDEMDEHYKEIAAMNDNEYLQNIKSIRYLETDKYRRLLTFIDTAPYQIYIMGHSCGNSDRTLLNTLFEHKNCVSIKPFYYKKADGTDDYIDIVQNISRNFKNPTLMRDRVVNKTYCEPLPQNNS